MSNEWQTAFFCVSCEREMSHDIKMYNHGRCPHCGYKHPSASTIVATVDRGYMMMRNDTPWWKFSEAKYVRVFDDGKQLKGMQYKKALQPKKYFYEDESLENHPDWKF